MTEVREPIVIDRTVENLTATLTLSVGSDSSCFRGHFPDAPLVPGIVQVHWAMELAREVFEIVGEFAGLEVLKFQKTIPPDAPLSLRLEFVPRNRKLHFEYRLGEDRASSGRILLR